MKKLIGLVAVALLALTACGDPAAADGQTESRYVGGDGRAVIVPTNEREPAPKLSGELLDGQQYNVDYTGKVTALNVWASWCPPCRAEAPALDQIATEMRPSGVQFVGMDTRDDRAAAQQFEKRFEVSYPSLWDPAGQLQLAFRDTLPPQAIPSTLLVDKQGRVAGRILGPVDRTQLREMLTQLANEPAT